jgi:hypothetical protein
MPGDSRRVAADPLRHGRDLVFVQQGLHAYALRLS